MTIIGSQIKDVRACPVPGGIGSNGRCFDDPLNVLVYWKSGNTDKLHQVYVNGKFADVTEDVRQSRIRIYVPTCWDSVSRISVYAVEPEFQHEDYGDELIEKVNPSRVVISWPGVQSLPYGGRFKIYSNNGSGQIDYSSPVIGGQGLLWPNPRYKGGFGLSSFGRSDFGYDGSACPGLGRGRFGNGEFGFDADMLAWRSDELKNGVYKFAVKIFDAYGSEQMSAESDGIVVIRSAKALGRLELESSDEDSTLNFSMK